jgi:hypothetical protein
MTPLFRTKIVIVGGTSDISFAGRRGLLTESGCFDVCPSNAAADKVAAASKHLDAGERVTAKVVNSGT